MSNVKSATVYMEIPCQNLQGVRASVREFRTRVGQDSISQQVPKSTQKALQRLPRAFKRHPTKPGVQRAASHNKHQHQPTTKTTSASTHTHRRAFRVRAKRNAPTKASTAACQRRLRREASKQKHHRITVRRWLRRSGRLLLRC